MSIISNNANTIQGQFYLDIILYCSKIILQNNITIQQNNKVITSLKKTLNYQKRKIKQLSLEIKKLNGSYLEPINETSKLPVAYLILSFLLKNYI